MTPSMRISASELKLEHLWILYPGNQAYPLEKNISTLPLKEIETLGNL